MQQEHAPIQESYILPNQVSLFSCPSPKHHFLASPEGPRSTDYLTMDLVSPVISQESPQAMVTTSVTESAVVMNSCWNKHLVGG